MGAGLRPGAKAPDEPPDPTGGAPAPDPTTRTMRSRLEPMKDVARMVRSHRDLILNWFRARGQFSSGVVEGFNGKARVITKRAYGFRTSGALEVALYHALGDLPEPELTHRFC